MSDIDRTRNTLANVTQERDTAPPKLGLPPHIRVAPFPARIDLGEHIVGSCHELTLLIPRAVEHATVLVSPRPAAHEECGPAENVIEAAVKQRSQGVASAHRAEAFSPVAPFHMTTAPVPIRFWPSFAGVHETDVTLVLRWPDGTLDTRVVRVHAKARRLNDAPSNASLTGDELAEARDPTTEPDLATADTERVRSLHKNELDRAYEEAKTEAIGLAGAQKNGLETARDNAESYQRKPKEGTAIDRFAELAISMAISGIAGLAARAAADALGPKLAMPVVADANTPNAPRTGRYSEVMVSDAVKEGLKGAAKLAMAAKPSNKDHSSDPFIEFFARQRTIVNNLSLHNLEFVDREHVRLQHVLLKSPQVAIASMQAIKHGLQALVVSPDPAESAAGHAQTIQQEESERQWVSLVAQSAHGSDEVMAGGRTMRATHLDRAPGSSDGLLTIHAVPSDVTPGIVRSVVRATMTGISQEVCDGLHETDLQRAMLPLKIILVDGAGKPTAQITRDEVGRVRRVAFAELDEVQWHRDAESIVQHVCSRTLKAWGVAAIESDDTTAYVAGANRRGGR
ncbi:MAG TPA: hypothetical protein VFQ53_37515 [Kofleriaceae bacterium]|nr:hypothetical protein [Kofleriaceae bacterium]